MISCADEAVSSEKNTLEKTSVSEALQIPKATPADTLPAGEALDLELSEEDQAYIRPTENTQTYFQAQKLFQQGKTGIYAKKYGKPIPNAETLFLLMRQTLIDQRKTSGFKLPVRKLPAGWEKPYESIQNGPEADFLYRYGDMDNLGYGWPSGFDPFSGENTPRHDYPYYPEPNDPRGTDRIMVNSGYDYAKKGKPESPRADGYTTSTERPFNKPDTLNLKFNTAGVNIKTVVLQLFVDDFQAPSYQSQFQVVLNGQRAAFVESPLNELKQGGPIGKLISFVLLPEYHEMIRQGKLSLFIDSPETPNGDGFAIDFVRILINPKSIPMGRIEGKITDAKTRKPIPGAMIRISGWGSMETDAQGNYVAENVPCGLGIVQAGKAGYKAESKTADIVAERRALVNLKLEPEDEKSLQDELDEKGKIDLYGIYFDTDKDEIKPESENTLRQILALIKNNPAQKLEIAGHTDAEGNDKYNLDLSKKRAESVIRWLQEKGASVTNLSPAGYGETRPVSDNGTATGRALNRRVEIRKIE